MSDSVFSSGAGKVVIYYAAADGVGQRVTRPATLDENLRQLLPDPCRNQTETPTAGERPAGMEKLHEENRTRRFRRRGGADAGGARLRRGGAADEDAPVPLHGQ